VRLRQERDFGPIMLRRAPDGAGQGAEEGA
jgi:hypothetical protein